MLNDPIYKELLDSLERSIFRHITKTDAETPGRSREPVLFQIDHGTDHLKRVRENMEILLAAAKKVRNPKLKLEEMHCFIAMAGAQFHDLGMHFGWYALYPKIKEPPTLEEADWIRKNHGRISAEWFRLAATENPPSELKDSLSKNNLDILADHDLNRALAFVIEAHQWPNEKKLETELKAAFTDDKEKRTMRTLACMVKLADTLDMDCRRVYRPNIERMVNGLAGRQSDISANIGDITRMLMVYYMRSASFKQTDGTGQILKITLDPKVSGTMLRGEEFQPFLSYLRKRYEDRLLPSYVSRILEEELGIEFTFVHTPPFKSDAALYSLPSTLLPKLMESLNIRKTSPDTVPPIVRRVRVPQDKINDLLKNVNEALQPIDAICSPLLLDELFNKTNGQKIPVFYLWEQRTPELHWVDLLHLTALRRFPTEFFLPRPLVTNMDGITPSPSFDRRIKNICGVLPITCTDMLNVRDVSEPLAHKLDWKHGRYLEAIEQNKKVSDEPIHGSNHFEEWLQYMVAQSADVGGCIVLAWDRKKPFYDLMSRGLKITSCLAYSRTFSLGGVMGKFAEPGRRLVVEPFEYSAIRAWAEDANPALAWEFASKFSHDTDKWFKDLAKSGVRQARANEQSRPSDMVNEVTAAWDHLYFKNDDTRAT